MTPPEFRALVRRWQGAEKRADYRAGAVAAILANVHRDTKKRPEGFTPGDFFPSLVESRKSKAEGTEKKQTPEEMRAVLIGDAQAPGGKAKEKKWKP